MKFATVVMITAAVTSALLPTAALAGTFREIPPWERITVEGVTYACYDFEAAKQLKLVDVSCADWHAKSKLLGEDLKRMRSKFAALVTSFDQLEQSRLILDEHLAATEAARNKAILDMHKARARDVFGGGMLWLVTTAALFLAAGLVSGYYFARK